MPLHAWVIFFYNNMTKQLGQTVSKLHTQIGGEQQLNCLLKCTSGHKDEDMWVTDVYMSYRSIAIRVMSSTVQIQI